MKKEYLRVPSANLREVYKKLAKNSLINFVIYTKRNYDDQWFHHLICDKLDDFIKGDSKRLMIFVPPQHGKELADSTPILTPKGFIRHGDLVVGDYVFGRDGKVVEVLAVSEKVLSEYEIEFTDGEIIQCHGNHEWLVYDRIKRKEVVYETKQLALFKLDTGVNGNRGHRYHYQVDSNVMIHLPPAELPVNPYLLGVWLGDGTSKSGCITHHKDDIEHIEFIKGIGYEIGAVLVHNTTNVYRTCILGLQSQLNNLGLLKNKRIPEIYFISSVRQRLELLAGLIDTDGYVYHKNGRVTFSNINKDLINDVERLVLSLGCKVTICEFEPILSTSGILGKHIVYQLCFNPNFHIPCKIERKKTINIQPKIRKRGIKSVRKVSTPEYGNCIQVEGGIYLAGKKLIPTHNSELVSRRLPAFLLGNNPTLNILVASYSQNLASSFNRDTQRIIDSEYYQDLFPNVRLATPGDTFHRGEIKRTTAEFEIAGFFGRLISVGVTGSLTGKTVDIGIIDDPIKDAVQAYSQLYRDKVWDWYLNVFLTRMHNDSKVLVTLTRWHEDDLAGRILAAAKENKEEWEIIILPAIRESNRDSYDIRNIGDALWPAKHSKEKILKIKNTSPTVYNSLYQQSPAPEEGNRIKINWVRNFSMHELRDRAYDEGQKIVWDFVVDSAYTSDIQNDPTGLLAYCILFGNIYVRDAATVRLELPELIKFIPSFCVSNGYTRRSRIFIEPKASGLSVAQMLRARTGLNIVIDKSPTTSKESRVSRCIPFMEGGRLFVVEAAAWRDSYIHQLRMFPNGAYDDLVDCTTMAIDKVEVYSDLHIYGFAAI